jgi:hypothetical protein
MIVGMTRPSSASRVVLVADRRRLGGAPAPVIPFRRYRLARLRLEGRSTGAVGRFEYLKHPHD